MTNEYDISLATPDDVSGIIVLQEPNLPANGGTLSVRQPADWFTKAILEKSVVVARRDGKVVGYVLGTSLAANAHKAMIQAMLSAYPAPSEYYLYGPVCVAESERGRGLAARCLKNCERAFLDALPCFSCGPTTPPRSERTRKWGCATSAHL